MESRKCKGAVINGQLKYIKKKWGQLGMKDAMAFAGLSKAPMDGEWVPISRRDRIYEWLIKNKGKERVYECGQSTAMDLGIFSLLFAFVGLEKLLKRAKMSYNTLYNFGDVIIEKTADGKIEVTLKDVGTEDFHCDEWEGAISGLMKLTKSRGKLAKKSSKPGNCAYIIELR